MTLKSVLQVVGIIKDTTENSQIAGFNQLRNTEEYRLLQELLQEHGSSKKDIRVPTREIIVAHFKNV